MKGARMWIKNFEDGEDDFAIQTWVSVGRFYLSVVLKVPIKENRDLENAVMRKLEKKLQKIELEALKKKIKLEGNDIRFSSICFVLLDQKFSTRVIKESEDLFVQLLKLSAKRFGKISTVNLDKYLTEKSDEARVTDYRQWLTLHHYLCSLSSQFQNIIDDNTILNCLRKDIYKANLEKLQALDLSDISAEISDNQVLYTKV